MKGQTIIELRDIKTGNIEKYVDNNMVTNAIQYYLDNFGTTNPTAFSDSSIYNDYVSTLLGGLLLLDSPLTESVEHVTLEGGIGMTGNGVNGISNISDVTEMGSYNTNESGWQTDGSYVQVWDFTTSQANGTIACACLTSDVYGYIGAGNKTSMTRRTSSDYTPVKRIGNSFGRNSKNTYKAHLNINGNLIKYVTMEGSTLGDGLRITKEILPITELNLKADLNSPQVVESTLFSIPQDIPKGYSQLVHIGNEGTTAYYACLASYNSNYGYYSISQSDPIYILGADDNNQLSYICTITLTSLGITANSKYIYNEKDVIRYNNGHIILSMRSSNSDSGGNYYDINLDNMAITELTNARAIPLSMYVWHTTENAIYTGNAKIDMVDKSIYPVNSIILSSSSGRYIKRDIIKNPLGIWVGQRAYRNAMYLATINNLETPVVKTAEKTMKVTYRLTF